MKTNCSVLVVGSGPVGLTCALTLATYGVKDIRIVEKRPQICQRSRALVAHVRMLEMLARLGLADNLDSYGIPIQKLTLISDAETKLAEISQNCEEGAFKFPYLLDQRLVCEILRSRLEKAYKIRPELNSELVDLQEIGDSENKVIATILKHRPGITPSDSTEYVECEYVIGCDGTKSTVRKIMKVPFNEIGLPPHSCFLADCDVSTELPLIYPYLCVNALGVVILCPITAADPDGGTSSVEWDPLTAASRRTMGIPEKAAVQMYRVGLIQPARETNGSAVTLNDIEIRARKILQTDAIELSNPRWISCVEFTSGMAETNRPSSRVFLAGDSVHRHSPLGGQGMNLGVIDGFNLSWKMAGVLQGFHPKELLSTYVDEQLAHDRMIVDQVHTMSKQLLAKRSLFKELLGTFVPRLLCSCSAMTRRFSNRIGGMQIQYKPNLVVADDFFERVCGGPPPGYRAPEGLGVYKGCSVALHEILSLNFGWDMLLFTGGKELGEYLDSNRFDDVCQYTKRLTGGVTGDPRLPVSIVIKGSDRLKYFERYNSFDGVILDTAGSIHEAFHVGPGPVTSPAFYIIRPDGFVGARGHLYRDIGRAYNYIRSVFNSEVTPHEKNAACRASEDVTPETFQSADV